MQGAKVIRKMSGKPDSVSVGVGAPYLGEPGEVSDEELLDLHQAWMDSGISV